MTTPEYEKFRSIAETLQERIDALADTDDSASRAEKRGLVALRNKALWEAGPADVPPSLNEQSNPDGSLDLYEVTDWENLSFEKSTDRVMTPEEVVEWVETYLVEHPEEGVRLGFTDDMSVEQKALKILASETEQPDGNA